MQRVAPLEIEQHEDRDGVVRLALRGELDVACTDRLMERLDALARASRSVVVDLRGLTFMDSTGLKILWAATQSASNDGWSLSLIQGPEPIRSVFEMSGLAARLPFVEA
jgi:anti-anti-sigma factor